MKTMEIYEPSMCCSTGVCGVNVDTELLRVATALNNLKNHGVEVDRYNLSSAPQAFITNKVVAAELQANGMDSLPLVVLDGEIVIKKRYPTNEEFCSLLDVPCDYVSAEPTCCGAKPVKLPKKNSGCCGSGGTSGGGCCC